MPDKNVPNIAEKVRFWEEQDRINQALIPRVMEMHEALCDLHKRTANISEQIAAAEARMFKRIRSSNDIRLVAYASLALAATACALSLYQLLA